MPKLAIFGRFEAGHTLFWYLTSTRPIARPQIASKAVVVSGNFECDD
jgi:hypothetical protein